MAVIFAPDHYETAARVSPEHGFSDAWSETSASLNLTLQAAEAHGEGVLLSKEDLIGYQCMHYGDEYELVRETVEHCVELTEPIEGRPWDGELQERLGKTIVPYSQRPAPLGRIAIGSETVLDDALTADVERVRSMEGRGATQKYISDKAGEFIYPRPGVSIHYLGRSSIILAHQAMSMELRRLESPPNGELLNCFAIHSDMFVTRAGDTEKLYNALTYEHDTSPHPASISRVSAWGRHHA